MNIFYVDRDPSTAAKMHCDKHVCHTSSVQQSQGHDLNRIYSFGSRFIIQ